MAQQQVNFHDELCEINHQQCELIMQEQGTIKFQQNIIIQFQDAASTQKSTKQDNSSHFQYMRTERQCFAQKKSLDVLRQTVSQHQKWFLEFKEREEDNILNTEILEGSQTQVSGNEMNTSSISNSQHGRRLR